SALPGAMMEMGTVRRYPSLAIEFVPRGRVTFSRAARQPAAGRSRLPPGSQGMQVDPASLNAWGFYPEITDGCKRAENFRSCLAILRRILGLWNRSMYSNTSVLAASSVGYFVR